METESNILRSPALIRQTIGTLRDQGEYSPSPGILNKWVSEPLKRYVTRSEEHTSELQSLMRISYAVFCLNKQQKLSKASAAHVNYNVKRRRSSTTSSNL